VGHLSLALLLSLTLTVITSCNSVNSMCLFMFFRTIILSVTPHPCGEFPTIQVWDAQKTGQVSNSLQGHTSSVNFLVAFSSDGKYTVPDTEGHTVQCWDAQTESSSSQAGNSSITLFCQPHPVALPPIYMPTSMLSALPNAGDKLTHMAKHSNLLEHSLFLLHDGWIVDSNDQLFLWVPPSYHPFCLYSPSTRLMIGNVPAVDFSNMAHGPTWHQCFFPCSDSM